MKNNFSSKLVFTEEPPLLIPPDHWSTTIRDPLIRGEKARAGESASERARAGERASGRARAGERVSGRKSGRAGEREGEREKEGERGKERAGDSF